MSTMSRLRILLTACSMQGLRLSGTSPGEAFFFITRSNDNKLHQENDQKVSEVSTTSKTSENVLTRKSQYLENYFPFCRNLLLSLKEFFPETCF